MHFQWKRQTKVERVTSAWQSSLKNRSSFKVGQQHSLVLVSLLPEMEMPGREELGLEVCDTKNSLGSHLVGFSLMLS